MASSNSPEVRRLIRKKIRVSPVSDTSVMRIADASIRVHGPESDGFLLGNKTAVASGLFPMKRRECARKAANSINRVQSLRE